VPRAIGLEGPVDAGREVGAEDGAEDCGTHDEDATFPLAAPGAGRPGKGFAELAKPDAVPHDLVCDTEERDD
jgi:hypothetical protein